jgi:hypothetical protein
VYKNTQIEPTPNRTQAIPHFQVAHPSDFLVVPPVLRPQYNHIIGPLPYSDATEHVPMMVLLNFSSTSWDVRWEGS